MKGERFAVNVCVLKVQECGDLCRALRVRKSQRAIFVRRFPSSIIQEPQREYAFFTMSSCLYEYWFIGCLINYKFVHCSLSCSSGHLVT